MFFSLIPTNDKFFEMFQHNASIIKDGAQVLQELVSDPENLMRHATRLERLEHDLDVQTHEILILLDKSFITPIDREDIHQLALALDDCMDFMEAASERMILYNLQIATEPMKQLVSVLVRQAEQLHQMMPLVKEVNYEKINPFLIEVNRLENEGDKVARKAVAELFNGNTNPLDVMKWRDIYDFLETATDKCEHVAGIVEGIVLKHG